MWAKYHRLVRTTVTEGLNTTISSELSETEVGYMHFKADGCARFYTYWQDDTIDRPEQTVNFIFALIKPAYQDQQIGSARLAGAQSFLRHAHGVDSNLPDRYCATTS